MSLVIDDEDGERVGLEHPTELKEEALEKAEAAADDRTQ
jgi:hypothetical protein